MKLAAIDIGSNAVRLLIEQPVEHESGVYFRKISLTRVPLRLGEDVFDKGKISKEKQKKLIKVMKAFRYLMEANDVFQYKAVATSAMREASNGDKVRDMIVRLAKVPLEIISGDEEAKFIFENFHTAHLDPSQSYLYIDVGGGSTEVTLIKNNKRAKSRSFPIGTVRVLNGKDQKETWVEAKDYIAKLADQENEVTAIGTGGSINRIFKEAGKKFGEEITSAEIKDVVDHIESYSLDDRIRVLRLKPDRADVIVPAGLIYQTFMKAGKAQSMIVPKVGLADGIIYDMYLDSMR